MNTNQLDQEFAALRDGLPRVWKALYVGCLAQGFTADQSMALLQTHILGINGVRPPTVSGPAEEDV